jgi:hypothetical protein
MLLKGTAKRRNLKTLIALYSLKQLTIYQLVGDSDIDVARAEKIIVGILYADDEERNRIRTE